MFKLLSSAIMCLLFANICSAQIVDGIPGDSLMIRMNTNAPSPFLVGDTSATPLWQIGLTHKPFFATVPGGVRAMMTDTTNFYPANANNSFTIKAPNSFNMIVDFWHRYQTDSTHAGGIVEYSTDNGATWVNAKGPCTYDAMGYHPGVHTSGFYSLNDTLTDGEPAFMGQSVGQQYSRIQFFVGLPLKTTGTSSCTFFTDTIYVRFRFSSDATSDTLAGWMIDSVKIEHDDYSGGVTGPVNPHTLNVFPNPSSDGSFTFPLLQNESDYATEIYNSIGQLIKTQRYSHTLQLNDVPKGLYLYKVTNKAQYYSGQLLIE